MSKKLSAAWDTLMRTSFPEGIGSLVEVSAAGNSLMAIFLGIT